MAEPDWKLLETFVHVARTGSLTAAARALGTSQPTVSRAIAELEEQLGARLFVRHSRGLGLSERGADLYEDAKRLDEGVHALFRRAAGLREVPAGTVRLSVNEPLGALALPPCFAALRRDYPDIALEVVIDNAIANLSRREADVAVRMFRPQQLDLVARKVGLVRVGLFASKSYLERHGAPTSLEDAARHTLVGSDRDPAFLREIARLGLTPAHFAFRTDNLLAQIQAIVAGVGIGGSQLGIARLFPELVRVLPGFDFEPLEAWVVMHQDLRGNPAVRVVFEAVSAFLERYAAEQAGAPLEPPS
jgi:DNA-binding transcriptional LysR family regulator